MGSISKPVGARAAWLAGTALVCLIPGLVAAQPQEEKAELEAVLVKAAQLKKAGRLAEAAPNLERALELAGRVYGPRHPYTQMTLNILGPLYSDLGEYARAVPLYQRSLDFYEEKLEKDHPYVAQSLYNLAELYAHLRQYEKAEPLYQRSLAIREKKLGKDHLETAASLNELGVLYLNRGEYLRAEPLLQRCLEIREAKLPGDHVQVARSLNNLAFLYLRMGHPGRAEPLYQRSLQVCDRKQNRNLLDVVLENLAELYRDTGHKSQAESLYQRSLEIREARWGKSHPDLILPLTSLAQLYEDTAQHARAEAHYRRILEIREISLGKDHLLVASSLDDLAYQLMQRAQYTQAEPLYQRSLQIREAKLGKDHPEVAHSLTYLANLYQTRGRYSRAEPLYERSLQIREAKLGKDHPLVAVSLSNLALYHANRGQYARAEPLCERCLEIKERKRGKDHPQTATTLANLAALYVQMGQYSRAELLYRRSLEIREARLGKDHLDVASSLNGLAALYSAMGKYARAERLYERCLQIREAKLDKAHPLVALGLNNLAVLAWQLGQYDRAEQYYRRSLKILEDSLGEDHPDVANTLSNLAVLTSAMGKYARAEPLYQRALKIREEVLGNSHPDVALVLGNLACLYHNMGQDQRAESLHRRCLEIREATLGPDHPDVARALRNLALVEREKGRYSEAQALLERALAIFRARLGRLHPDHADCQHELACALAAQKHQDEALRLLDSALQGQRRHLAQVLSILGEPEQLLLLAEQKKYLNAALSVLLEGTLTDENLRRSATWALNTKAMRQQALSERQLLARGGLSPEARSTLAQLTAIRQELAHLTLVGTDMEQGAPERLQQLSRREKELAASLGKADDRSLHDDPWIELDEASRRLPRGSVLIDIVRFQPRTFTTQSPAGPPRYLAWLVFPQGKVRLVDLGPAAEMDRLVLQVNQGLQQAPQRIRVDGEAEAEESLRPALQELSRRLLVPLGTELADAPRWLISPDGSLWLVPWAALLMEGKTYAVEKHAIQLLVSGRDLLLDPLRLEHPVRTACILADPDFDASPEGPDRVAPLPASAAVPLPEQRAAAPAGLLRGRVGRLPGTAQEAALVAPRLQELTGSKPLVYTGTQASEAQLKTLERPRILMLSTHGFFLPDQEVLVPDRTERAGGTPGTARPRDREGKQVENPLLRCGLLLAGCNLRHQAGTTDEDGVLTGLEIVGLDLRGTQLVVLSACETGLGQVRTGEGVAGLRQAFQLAGAHSVLASLWQVSDRETVLLMNAFFEQLVHTTDRAEALAQAQRKRIESRRQHREAAHPFFWAAFTLTGLPGPESR